MTPKDQTKLFRSSFELPNNSLRGYFGRVREGNDEEYRTPFYKGKSLTDVLDGWQTILEPGIAHMGGLLMFENDLREKVGPLSIMKPLSERMDDIDAYYDGIHLKSKPIDASAIDTLLKLWGPQVSGLRIRSQASTWNDMRKSTSSGSPYFRKRREVFNKTIPCDVSFEEMSQSLNGKKFGLCAILGWRGQEGGLDPDDVKQRVIWMFPMAANVCELQFYQPLIASCQVSNLVPAWNGTESVDKEITELFDSKGRDDLVICTDFTKFDQHFNRDLQECALEVHSRLLTRSSASSSWLEQVFPIKYSIPLAYDWERVKIGDHGMASGSGGTNADETVAHKCLQIESAQRHKANLNPHSQCLGDDGILTYPGISVESVLDTFTSHGLEMNESKQSSSTEECTYLRRWHSREYRMDGVCVGVYSTYRALGKLCEQERFYNPDEWGPEMVCLRYLSILENCKFHPLREEFLDYCIKGDKYRLGLDIPGFLDNIERIQREATDQVQGFESYVSTQTGIDSWWVIQALKSRR